MNSTLVNANAPRAGIDSNFLYAGRASYVVRNPQGVGLTVKLSKAKAKTNPRTGALYPETFFVTVRFQNDSWTYVGNVSRADRTIVPSAAVRSGNVRLETPIKIAEWSLRVINGETSLPAGYSIQHTGRCGKCYKLLRDPESVRLGIGPVCRG